MKAFAIIATLTLLATPCVAMPIAPVKSDDGITIMVRKGGGSSRSAVSGRFVTRGYATRNRSTTVTHGRY
jgi:hypothetical protein